MIHSSNRRRHVIPFFLTVLLALAVACSGQSTGSDEGTVSTATPTSEPEASPAQGETPLDEGAAEERADVTPDEAEPGVVPPTEPAPTEPASGIPRPQTPPRETPTHEAPPREPPANEPAPPSTAPSTPSAPPTPEPPPIEPGEPSPEPSSPEAPASPSGRDSARIFFIGHSLVNHDMPRMVNELARSREHRVNVGVQVINGAPLRISWDESANAEGTSARAALPRGGFDVVVMTEAIPLAEHLEWNAPARYAGNFVDLARQGNQRTITYIYETWHSRNEPNWRRQLNSDRAGWESIARDVRASRPGAAVYIVPAGQALGTLHDRVAAGSVPGLTRMNALFSDDIHLNDRGNYFVALVQYATIFRRSPIGLTTVIAKHHGGRYDTPSAETARAMQEIAWEVVRTYPRSGVPNQPSRASAMPR